MKLKKTIWISITVVFVLVLSAIIVACSMFDTNTPVNIPEAETDWAAECVGKTWNVKDNYVTEDISVPDYFKSLSTLYFTTSESVVINKDKTNQAGPFRFEFSGLCDGTLFIRDGGNEISVAAHFSDNLLTLTTPLNNKMYLNDN